MNQKLVSMTELEQGIKAHATDRTFKERVKNMLKEKTDRLVVTSALALTKVELDEIVKKLNLTAVKNLEVENSVDPSLLMGLIIKFKNHYFDFSLRGRLNQITAHS